jgi:hypothetical protein
MQHIDEHQGKARAVAPTPRRPKTYTTIVSAKHSQNVVALAPKGAPLRHLQCRHAQKWHNRKIEETGWRQARLEANRANGKEEAGGDYFLFMHIAPLDHLKGS